MHGDFSLRVSSPSQRKFKIATITGNFFYLRKSFAGKLNYYLNYIVVGKLGFGSVLHPHENEKEVFLNFFSFEKLYFCDGVMRTVGCDDSLSFFRLYVHICSRATLLFLTGIEDKG